MEKDSVTLSFISLSILVVIGTITFFKSYLPLVREPLLRDLVSSYLAESLPSGGPILPESHRDSSNSTNPERSGVGMIQSAALMASG